MIGRRYFSTIGFALAVSLMLGCGGCRTNSKSSGDEPLKIGADLTLTGPTAYWSQQIKKGLDLAVEAANTHSGPRPIQVLYQDNQSNQGQAVSIFQRFATIDQVSVVITCFTPIAKPLRNNAANEQLPLVATVVSALDFGSANEWSFRDFPPQDQQATVLARYSYQKLGLRKVVSLVVNDDYGRDGDTAFRAEFAKLGGEGLRSETMQQTDTNVRPQITKILGDSPDGVLVIVRDNALGIAVKQLREAGFKGRIVGVNAFDAPVVWRAAGNAGEGVVFTSAYIDFAGDKEAREFLNAYKTRYKEEPDWVACYGYTIGQYLVDLLRKSGGDREKLRQALASLDQNSIRGRLRMSEKREVLSPIGIYEYRDGEKRLVTRLDPPTVSGKEAP